MSNCWSRSLTKEETKKRTFDNLMLFLLLFLLAHTQWDPESNGWLFVPSRPWHPRTKQPSELVLLSCRADSFLGFIYELIPCPFLFKAHPTLYSLLSHPLVQGPEDDDVRKMIPERNTAFQFIRLPAILQYFCEILFMSRMLNDDILQMESRQVVKRQCFWMELNSIQRCRRSRRVCVCVC